MSHLLPLLPLLKATLDGTITAKERGSGKTLWTLKLSSPLASMPVHALMKSKSSELFFGKMPISFETPYSSQFSNDYTSGLYIDQGHDGQFYANSFHNKEQSNMALVAADWVMSQSVDTAASSTPMEYLKLLLSQVCVLCTAFCVHELPFGAVVSFLRLCSYVCIFMHMCC